MKKMRSVHVGSYGLIIMDDKIALIKKARGGYTGLLDLPGGGIEHNETPVDALHRELMEEAGVTVLEEKLLTATARTFTWHYKEGDILEDLHHIGLLYQVKVKESKVKKEADGIDSNGCKFYEISKLKKDEITPFAIEGLEILGYSLNKE